MMMEIKKMIILCFVRQTCEKLEERGKEKMKKQHTHT